MLVFDCRISFSSFGMSHTPLELSCEDNRLLTDPSSSWEEKLEELRRHLETVVSERSCQLGYEEYRQSGFALALVPSFVGKVGAPAPLHPARAADCSLQQRGACLQRKSKCQQFHANG